jgi:hypothetical protein
MTVAVDRLPQIAPRDCRAWDTNHCDVNAVAAAYEHTYRTAAVATPVRHLAQA